MPSPLAHGFAGYAILMLAEPRMASDLRSNLKAMGTGIFFGGLADADFFVAYFTRNPVLQHHYFSHSIPFALLIGCIAYPIVKWVLKINRPFRISVILTAIYGSHLFLDYFTQDSSAPIGIPLLWPFTQKHFMAPVEIFMSIHRGGLENLFGSHNMEAMIREFFIMAPLAFASYLYARQKLNRQDAKYAR
jgi:membrane-bound metal-dependent hydrolase YbcI (DUF457 family)